MFWDPVNYLATLILVAIGSLVRHTLVAVFVALKQTLELLFDVERPPVRITQPTMASRNALAAHLLAIVQRDPGFDTAVFLTQVTSLFNTLQSAREQANPGLCTGLVAGDLAVRLVGTSQAGQTWQQATRLLAYEKASIVDAACRPKVDEIIVRVWSRRLAPMAETTPGQQARSDLLVEDWLFRRSLPTTESSDRAAAPPPIRPAPWMLEAVSHVSINLGRSRFLPSTAL